MNEQHVDVVVVGAGFAGLYMLKRFRELGLRTRVFEAGTGVGGTWYWNRYPGARCDVPSIEYSYSASTTTSSRSGTGPSATRPSPRSCRYIDHVADRFDLRRDITFDTRVTAAALRRGANRWTVDDRRRRSRSPPEFFVMATGCLSAANMPDIAGRDSFDGPIPTTPVSGRTRGSTSPGSASAVIGTGSSAVQSIPIIAEQAEQLTVFQRTPTYAVPAHNRPLEIRRARTRSRPTTRLRARQRARRARPASVAASPNATTWSARSRSTHDDPGGRVYEDRWEDGGLAFLGAFNDLLLFARGQRHSRPSSCARRSRTWSTIPRSPRSCMSRHDRGLQALCVDTGYYETFNRPNVDARRRAAPRRSSGITPTGIEADGRGVTRSTRSSSPPASMP